jgi:hypothetical protein
MAIFANSVALKTSHKVELRTDWGAYEKGCTHDGYEPGHKFCLWLIDNTSTEFAYINIQRALSCLDKSLAYAGGGSAKPEYLTGKVESYEAKYADENVRVELEYSDGIEGELPLLRITAERWTLEK